MVWNTFPDHLDVSLGLLLLKLDQTELKMAFSANIGGCESTKAEKGRFWVETALRASNTLRMGVKWFGTL